MIGSAFVRKSPKNSDWNAQEHGMEADSHRSHKLFSTHTAINNCT